MDGIKAPYYAYKIIQGTTDAFGGMIIDQRVTLSTTGQPYPTSSRGRQLPDGLARRLLLRPGRLPNGLRGTGHDLGRERRG